MSAAISAQQLERVLKDQLEMALVFQFNRTGPRQVCTAVKPQSSAVIQFYSTSTGSKNPFSSLFIVADCGCDMTGLKHDTSQPPQSAINKRITPTWKTKWNTSYTYSQNDIRSVEKLHTMRTQYSAFGFFFFCLSYHITPAVHILEHQSSIKTT